MSKFTIPVTATPEEADKLIDKAAHLSPVEKAEAKASYCKARITSGNATPSAVNAAREEVTAADKPKYESNPNPAIPLGDGKPMDPAKVLTDLSNGKITQEDALRLINQPKRGLYCKVSQKGALSLYGLQRMPVTLYVEQWQRLFDSVDALREVIRDHAGEFSRKAESVAA
jgi:hypothetical protein